MSDRGGKRRAPGDSYNPRRTFICYLACRCCGMWWPVCEAVLRQLLAPWAFTCPLCAAGRKKACETWDGETHALPVPAMLDVRVSAEVE
jgi:hypothetical protein